MNQFNNVAMGFAVFVISLMTTPSFGDVAADRSSNTDRAESLLTSKPVETLFESSCLDCHSGDKAEGNLDLETLSIRLADAETKRLWVAVHDRVSAGEMPPEDYGSVDKGKAKDALASIAEAIRSHARNRRAERGGRSEVRRLTTDEWSQLLHDFFGPFDDPGLVPEEVPRGAFKTESSTLPLAAWRLQQWFDAAETAIATAVERQARPMREEHVWIPGTDLLQRPDRFALHVHGTSYTLFTKSYRGVNTSMTHHWAAPQTGWYRVRFVGKAFQSDGSVPFHLFAGRVSDFKEMRTVGYGDVNASGKGNTDFWLTLDEGEGFRVVRGQGGHSVFRHAKIDINEWKHDALTIDGLEIDGPFVTKPNFEEPLLDQIVERVCNETGLPFDQLSQTAVEKILSEFAIIALRVDDASPYLDGPFEAIHDVYQQELGSDAQTSTGLALSALTSALKRLVVQPPMTLRLESPGRLTPQEHATRVALALTRSYPRQTLQQACRTVDEEDRPFRSEVEQFVGSEQAAPFFESLANDWLQLSRYKNTTPNDDLYPHWDIHVEHSARRETLAFLRHVFEENRPASWLVDSDTVFVNRRMAEYYALSELPSGEAIEAVPLKPDDPRGGLWTQAAILRLTANGTSTSPITRGIWVLEALLDEPPPPPPSNVKAIEPDIRGTKTIREQLAKHQVGSCASCHSKIDPWGFALEAFDPAGKHRTNYARLVTIPATEKRPQPRTRLEPVSQVETHGELLDGSEFEDVNDLKAVLRSQPDVLARSVVNHLVRYVTGEPVDFADREAVEAILAKTRASDHRMRDLLEEVLLSDLVRTR